MSLAVTIFSDTYVDSVVALRGMREMRRSDAVQWATGVAVTPANREALLAEGVSDTQLAGAGAGDFCLAVRAADQDAADAALEAGRTAVFAARPEQSPTTRRPRSVRAATVAQPDSDVAIVSVPGEYAALPAYQALSAGMHVLLFSDNVPVSQEIELKKYARSRGLLVMGPGAGTAVLAGTGLGFANAVTRGRVGVVAAAGTGAQEVMSLLTRWGAGVSQVIGVGGRDLSAPVGGMMTASGIQALRQDPDTDVILLVSKPPDRHVAEQVITAAAGKPLVAAMIGLDPSGLTTGDAVTLADTLEGGVAATVRALGRTPPDTTRTDGPSPADARDRMDRGRHAVRGLFSGGTLCYESLVILSRLLGPVYSNTPIDPSWRLPAPPGSHQCLDLGEEEYTRGRPHPMIDPQARIDVLTEHAADPSVAAIVLDVVLGHGSNPDPAGVLAPICADVMAGGGPQVVAYVLGTDGDPQGWAEQRRRLVDAGCIVTETAARASLAAAALATGELDLLGARL